MSKQDFIDTVAPIAVKLHREGSSGIFPSVRIAQAMLETGGVLHPWNNLVGFKASKTTSPYWDGRTVGTATKEEYSGVTSTEFANWRVYNTIEDCFRDQDLLFEWSNYANVRNAVDAFDQCRQFILSPMKYATDSKYTQKLLEIRQAYLLAPFDSIEIAEEVDEMNEPLKYEQWQWDMLYNILGDAYNNGQLTWDWEQKILDKSLTGADLLFINTVLDGRLDRHLEV